MDEDVRLGIRAWSEVCWKEDWMNRRRWWTRLVNWYNWKFRNIYTDWTGDDEIAASIHGYIDPRWSRTTAGQETKQEPMTDHRRRAEELIGGIRVSSCHDSGCPQCSAVIREKITEVASALKEVEEETFARAEKAIQACDPMARGESLIFQTLLDSLREEAAKK